jgi:hypothetical protein
VGLLNVWERGHVYSAGWRENPREKPHLEKPGVDGDNIKMDLQVLRYEGIGWIDLDQDRERCRSLVNAVMKFRFL